jgi:hypothetical protein
MFVGRSAELDLLAGQHAASVSSFVPVYGRRRVGKSELILQFLAGKQGLYHVGKTAPAPLQLREFLDQAARVFDEPLMAGLATDDWRSAFEQVVRKKRPGKLIIALDEFQWLAAASPELPSVLQELWDRQWQRRGDIMLIVCGSYMGFMEKEVLGKKSPLFGRRTAQILLKPFSHREAAAFHPAWSLTEKAHAFFVCGGVPAYLRLFDPSRSFEHNLQQNLFDEFGPLFREPDFLLREELREIDSYYAVLLAIAEGQTTAKGIAARSALPERSLPYYLQQLVELGYVARRHPLTGKIPATRQVRYVLTDPLLRFWFRFVFPSLSFLQQMGPTRTFRERVRPDLPAFFAGSFKQLCRASIPRIHEREGVSAAFEVGEYWDKEVQIDLVVTRQDKWTDLGECKWGTVRSPVAVLAELEAKVPRYPNPGNATVGLRLFVHKVIRAPASQRALRVHDLADLYA